jgi:ketosteroid isomerase-like protein
MTIDYAAAGDLLEAYGRAVTADDGDAWVALFTEDVEFREDPFEPPLVGHVAVRAYLGRNAETRTGSEFTVERHWVSGATVLAAWHGSFDRRETGRKVRLAGFMTLEVAPDGRISRLRKWWHRHESPGIG